MLEPGFCGWIACRFGILWPFFKTHIAFFGPKINLFSNKSPELPKKLGLSQNPSSGTRYIHVIHSQLRHRFRSQKCNKILRVAF